MTAHLAQSKTSTISTGFASFRRLEAMRDEEDPLRRMYHRGTSAQFRRRAASGPPASGGPDAIGADSSCNVNQGRAPSCMGCKKWLTARLPIFSPWFVPVSTASRKWKPT